MEVSHILAVCCIGFFSAFAARAGDAHALPARHAKAGVTCFDCHQEETPSARPVDPGKCMDCHGDGPAMAATTRQLPVNPHAPPPKPHPGPFACTDCHRQHQPPVVKCLECHPKFKLVPR